jgi:glutathione S-transferase
LGRGTRRAGRLEPRDGRQKRRWPQLVGQPAKLVGQPAPAAPASAGAHPPLQATLWRPDYRYDDENVVLVIDGATDSLVNVFFLELDGILPTASSYLQRQLRRAERSLTWLEARFQGRTTLAEGAFSFADIALVCALDWMIFRSRYDVSRHPVLCRLLEQHESRPSLARTHPSCASTP